MEEHGDFAPGSLDDVNQQWKTFIDKKDLGITWVDVAADDKDCYKILDVKKWLLSKLKYGL